MGFLGFGRHTPEAVSEDIASLANGIRVKAQHVIASESASKNIVMPTTVTMERVVDDLDQIEQMVKDAKKRALKRLKVYTRIKKKELKN